VHVCIGMKSDENLIFYTLYMLINFIDGKLNDLGCLNENNKKKLSKQIASKKFENIFLDDLLFHP